MFYLVHNSKYLAHLHFFEWEGVSKPLTASRYIAKPSPIHTASYMDWNSQFSDQNNVSLLVFPECWDVSAAWRLHFFFFQCGCLISSIAMAVGIQSHTCVCSLEGSEVLNLAWREIFFYNGVGWSVLEEVWRYCVIAYLLWNRWDRR